MLTVCWILVFFPALLRGQDSTSWESEKMMAIQKKEENQRLNRLSYPEHLFESQVWQPPNQSENKETGIPGWVYLLGISAFLGLGYFGVKIHLGKLHKTRKQELLTSLLDSLSGQVAPQEGAWHDMAGTVLSLLSVSSLQKTSIQPFLSSENKIEKLGFTLPLGKKSADLSIALGEALMGYPGATLQVESTDNATQTYFLSLPPVSSGVSRPEESDSIPAGPLVKEVDQQFLSRANQIVSDNLGDAQFNAEAFREEIGMSKTHFYRKLQELTQQSPGQFIRTMRLTKARQMLEAGTGNVSEVAYEVGFNNLSYFSRCFRNEFGILPSEVS